jgi:outer membrane protein assembly factor BamB
MLVLLVIVALAACNAAPPGGRASRSERAEASSPQLDRRWVVPGPRNPQAIAADRDGVVAVGRYGPIVERNAGGHEEWRVRVVNAGEQLLGPLVLSPEVAVTVVTPGRVVAVDRGSGEERWSASITDPLTLAIDPRGAGAVAVITASGHVEVLDAADGRSRWSAQLPFTQDAGPISVHARSGSVAAAWAGWEGGHLQVFDLASGVEQWSAEAPMYTGTPAVTDDAIVVSENLDGEGRTARIARFDLETGAREWIHELAGPFLPFVGVAVGRDLIAVVNVPGVVTGLDAQDGSTRWRRKTGRLQYAADPHLVGPTFAMTTYGTGLVALSSADGATVPNDAPGPVQLEVTFEGSAAVGDRLYLLASRSRGSGEIWMLSAS